MGDQENSVPTISAPKRRASVAAQPAEEFSKTKKRVVLGELTITNSPNVLLSQSSDLSSEKSLNNANNKEDQGDSAVSSINRQKCSYASSIYKHLRALEIEVNRRPLPNYMEKVQTDLSGNMREILVDWLVEVAEEYKLASDTLYLAVSYVDRFLSAHAIPRSKLQLLGVSSMLIAAKYEEITPPNVEDFCYITDNSYILKEVIDMEKEVLRLLKFEMSNPTAKNFLRIFVRVAQENFPYANKQLEFLASYLLELILLDYQCVRFLPSVAAASAVFLARFTFEPKKHPWSLALQCHTGYKPSDIKECVLAVHDLQRIIKKSSLRAVRDKYRTPKFTFVSSLNCPDIPPSYFEPVYE